MRNQGYDNNLKKIQELANDNESEIEIEQEYANGVFSALDREYCDVDKKIHGFGVGLYDVGDDEDERANLNYIKECQIPDRNHRYEINKYCCDSRLYSGHVMINNEHYYITDNSSLESLSTNEYRDFIIVNTDDVNKYSVVLNGWHNPTDYSGIQFSKDIELNNKTVLSVDVIFDTNSDENSGITDSFLKKALLKNKKNGYIGSIIKTIQDKQNKIRLFPYISSFVVQGCAGSGKTMVMLHRIRYLLYNKYLNYNNYILLTPSKAFNDFISEMYTSFNIGVDNVRSLHEYYKRIASNEKLKIDTNELLFSEDFLSFVYSKELLQKEYRWFIGVLESKCNDFLAYCENFLVELEKKEKETIVCNNQEIENKLLEQAKIILSPIYDSNDGKFVCINDIFETVAFLDNIVDEKKKKILEISSISIEEKTNNYSNELKNNPLLSELIIKIEKEKEIIEKTSKLFLNAHINKLKGYEKQYQELYSSLLNEFIEQEKKEQEKRIAEESIVFNGINYLEIDDISIELKKILEKAQKEINENNAKQESFEKFFLDKYNNEISLLNSYIELSGEVFENTELYIKELLPLNEKAKEFITAGLRIFSLFKKSINGFDSYKIYDEFLIFSKASLEECYNELFTIFINHIKLTIKNEYSIRISKKYKHYWYLDLYCKYFLNMLTQNKYNYIFIDECQDISFSELELIVKINSFIDRKTGRMVKPVINAFGDINQSIHSHGISNWEDIPYIVNRFELNENFRNTNQIIDYCNDTLSIKMEKIGIDLDKVDIYDKIDDARRSCDLNGCTFIVKDEYIRKDMLEEISNKNIRNSIIYTVKEVKGLEFSEVFVVDSEMTENEKYISYTRALMKLSVIHYLPQKCSRKEILFEEGE